jgi:FkbM family methyltransferase
MEPQLRMVQRAIGPRETRRTMRDDEALRLLLALTLPAEANCVDIGANAGTLLRHMVRYAPHGHHIAFEPLPNRAAELRGAFPDVDVRQAAVASVSGTRRFTRVVAADTRSGFDVDGYDGQQVEELEVDVCTLDEALPADYVPALIKLDVEGAEYEALRGGLRVLTEHQPTVVFEHDARGDTSGVFGLLAGTAGLRIFDMDGDGPLSETALRTKVARSTHWNFIAHR